MSQHKTISNKNTEVMYGFDAPTGGYFFSEFLDKFDANVLGKDGLTLTDLLSELDALGISPDIDVLVIDFAIADDPTPLQYVVGNMFGKNIKNLLNVCKEDVKKYLK